MVVDGGEEGGELFEDGKVVVFKKKKSKKNLKGDKVKILGLGICI